MIATMLAVAVTAAAPVPADAHGVATKISSWGPRPAASDREARAHRLMRRVFRGADLRVGVQEFRVPGRGRSRNVIGVFDTPRSCLRIVMAHTDSAAGAPGANDNASGLGVLASLAGRLRLIRPHCDVWLVATGAEERIYTGSPDHLGALALARRARSHGARRRLRWALSLDEVGRDRPFWLRSPVSAERRGSRERCSARPQAWGSRSAGCATGALATPTTASSSCSACPPPSWAWARAASPAATWRATAPHASTPSRLSSPGG